MTWPALLPVSEKVPLGRSRKTNWPLALLSARAGNRLRSGNRLEGVDRAGHDDDVQRDFDAAERAACRAIDRAAQDQARRDDGRGRRRGARQLPGAGGRGHECKEQSDDGGTGETCHR